MIPSVHVLATCRNPELFPATRLVFDSIRVGFPTAEINVVLNGLASYHEAEIEKECEKVSANCSNRTIYPTVHNRWISELIRDKSEPFFICDTDVIFHENFERFDFDFQAKALAGRLIPRFFDEVTGCITYERLHTSLLYINPMIIRRQVASFKSKLCTQSPFYVDQDLVDPLMSVIHKQPYFHDTASQLYNAIGGKAFTPQQLDCYDHLNCGTYIDIAAPRMTYGKNLKSDHEKVFENPALSRGIWKQQENYYARFAA